MGRGKYLNYTEFAKLMGVTRRSVSYAAEKGRIKYKDINGSKMIHGQKGKKEWEQTIDKVASKKGKKAKTKKSKVIEGPKTFEGLTTADADRQEKVYKARLSQLKYLEQAGKLVDVDKVQKRAFELGRQLRDAIMSLPPRLAHELAAETDPHKLEMKLHRELTEALDKFIGAK